MKLFKFPLEPLRTLRRQKERVAQQQYARALAACDAAMERVREAERALGEAWDLLVAELRAGAAAASLLGRRGWCTALETRRDELQARLAEARQAAAVALQEMIAAVREREALERFHDKSRRAHERESQRAEQKNSDELAVQLSGTNHPFQPAGREA